MKNLLLVTFCVLLIAVPAVAVKQKYGPVPNYKGTHPAGASSTVPTAGTWYIYNPVTTNTTKFGGWGGGEYMFNYTAPIFVNSYIEVDPCAPSSGTMNLTEIVTYDEDPGEPYTIPNQRGFTASDPEVGLGSPSSYFFAGKSGVHYSASVMTWTVGALQLPGSPVQGYNTSKISGPPENIVYIVQTTIPAVQVSDFIGRFEYTISYLGQTPSGDPEKPYAHSFQLNITQWDPSVPKISDIDWEAPYIVPGYVSIVNPPNWVNPGGTWGRAGFEANTGAEISPGTGSFGFTVTGKMPYVSGGHAYLTQGGRLSSPVINTMIVGANAATDCGTTGRLAADLNMDCYVNFQDFAIFAAQWLQCTDPDNVNCTQVSIAGLGIVYDREETQGPARVLALYDTHVSELQAGDEIVEYLGMPISSGASLYTATQTMPDLTVGQTVPMTVVRSGSVLQLNPAAIALPLVDASIAYNSKNCTQVAFYIAFGGQDLLPMHDRRIHLPLLLGESVEWLCVQELSAAQIMC
jgi:hypothetical protein